MHKATVSTLFEGHGTFYQRMIRKNGDESYEPLGEIGDFKFTIEKKSRFSNNQYMATVYHDDDNELSQPISIQMELLYCKEYSSVHWSTKIDKKIEDLAFRFIDIKDFPAVNVMSRCVEVYNQCIYAIMTGTDVPDTSDEWYQYMAPANTRTIINEDDEKPIYAFDINSASQMQTGGGNICFSHAMHLNRALILRKHGDNANSLEMLALPVQDQKGRFSKSLEKIVVDGVDSTIKGSLMDATEHKLMVFGGEQNKIGEIDLERGKVVQEYNPGNKSIVSVAYSAKTADNSNGVYTCLAPNVAFNIDTRMDPRSCVVLESGKDLDSYSLKSAKPLTCHATSKAGHLATGDSIGNVRLYTGPPGSRKPGGGHFPKTAKTLLDTKTPILSLDITANGSHILATCENFILLINTKYLDNDGKEADGFKTRMGKHKPTPLRLLPSALQIEEMKSMDEVRFTSAKFDVDTSTGEHCVTASCGKFLLVWSMNALIKAEEKNRNAPCDMVSVGHTALSINTPQSSTVTYLSKDNIGSIPIEESKRSFRKWTWGQRD
ncbi:unnamed protein product [Phytomonas sp. Hart1]|nr:unnamed protein product [Phytomonas sp. Hart1]|eukprot:CCW70778.1 unnamed protein product [Phytomonas sp. isolate Hart1]